MNVSFNLANNVYSGRTFRAASKEYHEQIAKQQEKKEITAKTKKAVSECATVVLGASIFYFIMKRNFKINAIKSAEKQISEMAKTPPLSWVPDPGDIRNFRVNL